MKPKLLLLALFMMLSMAGFGQVLIRGQVTDENQQPLPGVSVLLKGSAQGTVTDSNGAYSIQSATPDATIVFSFIGYVTQEIPVNNNSTINASLVPDVETLQEVVVVGYGTQKKSVVTGAISSIKADELVKVNTNRIDNALQGRVAGVSVAATSNSPGASPQVVIRGIGTNGNYGPLYIIDGVQSGDMNHINANDVESIEVLKDAASSAIYGSRGANGIIIVTTKKGKKGAPSLNYDGYYGVQMTPKRMDLLNAREYVTLMRELAANDGVAPSPLLPTVDNIQTDTDWQDQIFEKAPVQSHNLNITGGSDRSSYLVSGSYWNQEGIIGGDKASYKRYTARVNTNFDVNDYIALGTNLSFVRAGRKTLPENNANGTMLSDAINIDPLTPVYANTNYRGRGWGQSGFAFTDLTNPLSRRDVINNNSIDNKILGNAYLKITPIKGLEIKTDIGVELNDNKWMSFTPRYWFTGTVNDGETSTADGISKLDAGGSYYDKYQWENTITYTRSFSDHNVSALVGTTALKENFEWHSRSASELPVIADYDAAWWYMDATIDSTAIVGGSRNPTHTLSSYFFRGSYNYKEKYMLNFIMRRDGSSNFGPNNRYAMFPSVSVGWNISDEPFWKVPAVDYLKLRAGWGKNGNEAISALQYAATLARGRNYEFGGPAGEAMYIGVSPDKLENPNVQWEAVDMKDIGLEIGLMNSALNVEVDYYIKTTTGLLLITPDLALKGNSPPFSNVGEIQNKGIEVHVDYSTNIGDVTLRASLNASRNINRVVNVGNESGYVAGYSWPVKNEEVTRMTEGHPIGFFYGYRTNGVFQSMDEVYGHISNTTGQLLQPDAQAGDFRFVDLNADGVLDSKDREQIGQPWPKWILGGQLNAGYKGFDFTLMFVSNIGQDVFRQYERPEFYAFGNKQAFYLDRWHGEGTSTTVPRMTSKDPNLNYRVSDFFVEDGDFLNIQTIQLGYTVPRSLTENLKIKTLRFYVVADNLLTLSNYNGFAENGIGDGWALSSGIDRGFYPQARTFRGGINLTF